jgi:WD40 repeat protein
MSELGIDVFVSYKSEDGERARRLAERLRDVGLRVWFDQWSIKPGDDIFLAIERALERARTMVLCLSPAALGSDWVGLERSTVLFRDPTNRGRRFIPVLLADCKLPDTLRRYRAVDYRKEDESALQELVSACTPEQEFVEAPEKGRPVETIRPDHSNPPAIAPERRIRAHSDWVNTVAVSPNGKWIISGSDDGSVMVHDLATGNRRFVFENYTQGVRRVAVTQNSQRILSTDGNTVRIWDAHDGRALGIYGGHASSVWSVVPLPDSSRVISSSVDGHIAIWSIEDGTTISHLEAGSFALIAVSGDGKLFASATMEEFRLWNVEGARCLIMLPNEHSNDTWSIALTRDGRHLVSGSQDMTIRVWDLGNKRCVNVLESTVDSRSLAFAPDDSLLVASGPYGKSAVWDIRSGACVAILEQASYSSVFAPNGSSVVAGASDGAILVYSLPPSLATRSKGRRYVNAKIVLIGESGVGKSGLAHRLIEDRFVPTESTHGMQVWELPLPLDPGTTEEREALLWDLAGQGDYRLVHQLFLHQTGVALVLINPQKEDPFAGVADWLKALGAAMGSDGADVVKLLVAARTDVGGLTVSQEKVDRFLAEHGFAGYMATSARTGEGCSDSASGGQPSALKQLVAAKVPWSRLPWTSTPDLLAKIKHALIEMREQKAVRLLRFAELCQRLEQRLPGLPLDGNDVRSAVTLLGNHGLVMAFAFGDLVLLRPELLNGYASGVIRAARAHVDEIGSVREQAVFERTIDLQGVDRLPPADEELLVRAMVQIFLDRSLCIAEETPEGRHLVFPSQYRRERQIPSHPDILVAYTFTGELQTIYTTLVVRLWYSREFKHKELWRDAAELTTRSGQTAGLVMQRLGEGEGRLSVFFEAGVADDTKVALIEYLHRHLTQSARDVRRERRYVCGKCAKPVNNAEAVRARLEAKKTFIRCQFCDAKVVLIDRIERELASDPVAQRVREMDRTAQEGLDTQALEQILIGHMLAICGEANQIFRPVTMFDHGVDGEVEFKDNDGRPSGRKIYVQLKSGDSYLRRRQGDRSEVFEVRNPQHLDYWSSQPVDVYLVIRTSEGVRWMNLTRHLKDRPDGQNRQIVFQGEKLDATAVWRARDAYIPPPRRQA